MRPHIEDTRNMQSYHEAPCRRYEEYTADLVLVAEGLHGTSEAGDTVQTGRGPS